MSAPTTSLLVEIGCEELPIKALPGLAQALADGLTAGLRERGVDFSEDGVEVFFTPRRLAARIAGVAAQQPTQRSEVFGPYVDIALDVDGKPTRALQGFAAKAGVAPDVLERISDARGERFVHRSEQPGASTASLLPELIQQAVAAIPVAKPMRWGDHSYAFARPVHWLTVLLGDQPIDVEIFGIAASRMSRGHRFLAPNALAISHAADYLDVLRKARVIADPAERRNLIVSAVEAAARAAGGHARIDLDNLEQVLCLTEWPHAITCSFDEAFLDVPAEALVVTMESNQKFFPVLDASGALTHSFVGVANVAPTDDTLIRTGYERVIRPRFADAKFFFDEDSKQGLDAMGELLANVTWQAKLGSLADKVARVAAHARRIARAFGADPDEAYAAAMLSKNDLMSRLVGEFPEMQGIAGHRYALAQGEDSAVALAIEEAYQPIQSGDAIAQSPLGRTLAVAERLDTLAGGFIAGLKPTGNKDPFALRRAALGLARTLVESGVELPLFAEIEEAFHSASLAEALARAELTSDAAVAARKQGVAVDDVATNRVRGGFSSSEVAELHDFILDRLRGYYADRGIGALAFAAVRAAAPATLADFDARIRAIHAFADSPEVSALAAADKRARNILRKSGADPAASDAPIDHGLFQEAAERELAAALDAAERDSEEALRSRDYGAVLKRLAGLRPPVDAFFEQVMVNAEDPAIRANRLALLRRLTLALGSVAAIEELSS